MKQAKLTATPDLVGAPKDARSLFRQVFTETQHAIGSSGVQPLTEYASRPLDFAVDILGVRRETIVWSESGPEYRHHEWDGDVDPFATLLEAAAAKRNVGIESGIGTGKTFTLAVLVLWFIGTHENAIIATCAPRRDQLIKRVWKEITALWPGFEKQFPHARLMDGQLRMLHDQSLTWNAYADVAAVRAGEVSATRVQGEHAENLCIIVEETPGVHPSHMVAFRNTLTGPGNFMIAVGNPDFEGDELHRFCEAPDVLSIRISALDHPNVVLDDPHFVPGASTTQWAREMKERHIATPQMYTSRVRGISPSIAIGAVYKYDPLAHTSPYSYAELRRHVLQDGWTVLVGIDTGPWRFATIIAVLSPEGVLHLARELWSSKETTDKRMKDLVDALHELGLPDAAEVHIWHDPGGGADTLDLRAAMKRAAWEGPLIQSASKKKIRNTDNQRVRYRLASFQRIADLMARAQILFATDLGQGLKWNLGASTEQRGEPRVGSRLLYEMKALRYPSPKTGKIQKGDPDESSADGADMIAALRFVAMQVTPRHRPTTRGQFADSARNQFRRANELAQPAPFPKDWRRHPPEDARNQDFGLERIGVRQAMTHARPIRPRQEKMIDALEEERAIAREEEAARRQAEWEAVRQEEEQRAAFDGLADASLEAGIAPEDVARRLLSPKFGPRGD